MKVEKCPRYRILIVRRCSFLVRKCKWVQASCGKSAVEWIVCVHYAPNTAGLFSVHLWTTRDSMCTIYDFHSCSTMKTAPRFKIERTEQESKPSQKSISETFNWFSFWSVSQWENLCVSNLRLMTLVCCGKETVQCFWQVKSILSHLSRNVKEILVNWSWIS